MPSDMNSLWLQHVSFSYLDGLVLQDVNLTIQNGEMVGLIGPNGSGKTTLLKLASGVLRPKQGRILLQGLSLDSLTRREVAQRVAVVPQQFHMPFAFTIEEMVLLGRTPFVNTLSGERESDRRAVRHAMQLIHIEHLEKRTFNELSGGERQKVILAMALAQQPKLLLLDEPTANLDINHRAEILELVRSLNLEQEVTVVAAMHDLNLAALYFDRLILLKEGAVFADGTPTEVLTEGIIQEVFSASVRIIQHPSANVPHVFVLPGVPPLNRGNREESEP